ncbi:MAG TPA: hypothetical protein VGK19_05355 [Capsulimonadaceae bacterium]
MKITHIALAALLAASLSPSIARAAEWKLVPITAHAPNVWKEAPNWTYEAGNPMTDNGARWTLSAQTTKDPSLTATYTAMEKATAWKYFYVWGLGAEQPHMYRDMILSSKAADNTPQAGPSSVIRFRPPTAGTYKIDIVGTAVTQNPTAGHCRATIYILSPDASSATQLAAVDLNNGTPGAFGSFPNKLNYHSDVPLKKDEELAVRLQTINPGPASAGSSTLTFDTFTVSTAKP